MAEIILTPLLQVIFEKIASPVLQEFADRWDLEDRFKKLQKVLPLAQAIIQDAEERQASVKAVRIWLSQLKEAAYKAEDLLEEFMYMDTRKSYSINITKSRNILDDLKKAVAEGLNLRCLAEERRVPDHNQRETSSFVIESEVCGRKEEKKIIMEMMLSNSSANKSAVSIVGVPGIGKSTLAQMVYNDDDVKRYFDLRIWVFVSPEFDAKKIIRTAIESVTGEKCGLTDLDTLQSKLWNELMEKKYLLVLDDVWDEDEHEWDKLRLLFGFSVDGSRVLITTRRQRVAMAIDSSSYHLKGLCEEDCWDLFRKRAFLNPEEENSYKGLLVIGKEIARKCRGVPLAAKVLGGLMRFKREERDWLHVERSEIWDLGVYRKAIFPALTISYLHLPLHLKHCFAFCLIFPKDYEIEREKLIHMWMAQGFILSNSDGESERPLEDIGEEYFNELLWLSVFEEVKFGCYKMNQVFYSIAMSVAKNEVVVLENGLERRNLRQVRHVSVLPRSYVFGSSLIPETLYQSKHLRTLLVFSEAGIQTVPSRVFSCFNYLRELSLTGCQVQLPDSIGEASFLRYLDLSNSHFQELPSTMSSLRSLQVLNLFSCYNLKHLPSMGRITDLRHLNISGCEALTEMPHHIGKLSFLQTLPIFIVSEHHSHKKKANFSYESGSSEKLGSSKRA